MPAAASLAQGLAHVLDRLPGAEQAIDSLPWPVRFADGRRRRATVGVMRMHRFWLTHPHGVSETEAATGAYDGGDVIDIGAYHGWYTLMLAPKARPGDRLVSVEPDSGAFPTLLRTLAAAGEAFPDLQISALHAAVGDGTAVDLSWPDGPQGHPRFSGGGDGDPTLTVDGLVATAGLKPALVKVDVEGAEWFVIQGMRETLREHHPVVLLEMHPRWQPRTGTLAEIETVLREAGYDLTSVERTDIAERQLWRVVAPQ